MNVYEVPVMVTVQSADGRFDSGIIAEVLHEAMMNTQYGTEDSFLVVSIDGIPSDEADPNSPPVPASAKDVCYECQVVLRNGTCQECGR